MNKNAQLDYLSFINTKDGSAGLYNSTVNDIYHSVFGAKEEAEDKFITPLNFEKNFFNKKEIRVLDICYGIGYNTKAFLKKIIQTKYNGKIFIDALEYDKNLVLISPFIKDGFFKKYPEVSYLLIKALLGEMYVSDIDLEKLFNFDSNKQFYTPFYRTLIKRFKFFRCKYKVQKQMQAFLHNIYYHCVSRRIKKPVKCLRNQNITFKTYYNDARESVKSLKSGYDIVFLDAFTPVKLPTLWSIDFFNKLYELMNHDSLLVTYSNSAAVRHAMIDAGFSVGKIFDKNNRASGTIASKNSLLIENKLDEYDLGLIKTSAGVYYKDKELCLSADEIIKEHDERKRTLNLQSSSSYIKEFKNKQEETGGNMYDVVVCGGGTAGVACAYIAAKKGLKTLVVEKNSHLGGTITSALVVPAMKSNKNNINCDFYNDFVENMADYNAQITYCDGNDGWFNPEIAKIVLDKMLTDAGCEILFNSEITNVVTEGDKVKSIKIGNETLSLYIESKYFVDCTGDGNFSAKLNNKILKNLNNFQSMTLRFNVSGIDLKKFSDWLMDFDKDRNVSTSCVVNGEIHLSTACTWDNNVNWALRPLFVKAVEDGVLKDADTAYFQLFTIPGMPGTVSLNCPRIMSDKELDPSNLLDASKALLIGRQQIWRIYNFMKLYLPGFENSFISNIADMLGIRESGRVEGKIVYSKDDIISGKTYDNPVLTADYPIDVHSNEKDKSVLDKVNQAYQLPIEALCASGYSNLFMAGRNLSADFEAQAALRIQTSCFSMGEAVAKHISSQLAI